MQRKAIELNLKWWIVDFRDPLQLRQAMNLASPQHKQVPFGGADS